MGGVFLFCFVCFFNFHIISTWVEFGKKIRWGRLCAWYCFSRDVQAGEQLLVSHLVGVSEKELISGVCCSFSNKQLNLLHGLKLKLYIDKKGSLARIYVMARNSEKFLPQFYQIPPVISSVLPHIPWVASLSFLWHTASRASCTAPGAFFRDRLHSGSGSNNCHDHGQVQHLRTKDT